MQATRSNWWRFWARATPSLPKPVREAAPDEDRDWRSIWRTPGAGERDLSPRDWRTLLQDAYDAYCDNPLAYAVIEQSTNFVLGGGVRVVAHDPRVQRAIDRFWNDPENRMDQRVYCLQTELALFGEQFIRFFVDPLSGRTVIRQLDPLYVETIESDPDDVERPLRYRYRPPHPGGQAPHLDGTWIDAADILHVAINKVSNATRGRSDLAPLLSWLRHYKQWLIDRVRINQYKGAFIYDVTVSGAHAPDLERKSAAWATPPAPATVLFHNDSETWRAVQPQIGADDVKDDGRALRLMIATGAGIPEHYLSEGGNANRATAAEMGLPAMKRYQRRQELLRDVLRRIVTRVLDEQIRVGRLGPRTNRTFAVEFDELGDARPSDLGPALASFTTALALSTDRGWVTPDEARRLWWRFTGDPDAAAEGPHP